MTRRGHKAGWPEAIGAGLLAAFVGSAAAAQQGRIPTTPPFTIWDLELGEPVTQIPGIEVTELACGTNGGPPSLPLDAPGDYMQCRPEESGLREIHFAYDDEQEYVARAMEDEYKVRQRGTSVYAHPVIVSALVDEQGIVQGRRIVTDDRVSERARRIAASLIENFKNRFADVGLDCEDIPPQEGEKPVGERFIHELCTGGAAGINYRLEASYLRKPGQRGINERTQEVNSTYYESKTRVEMVLAPYEPAEPPTRRRR